MAKPSYKLPHKARHGTATMEVEPAPRKLGMTVKAEAPHSEEIVPPTPPTLKKPLGISPTPPADGFNAQPGTVRPDEYARPQYTGISKT